MDYSFSMFLEERKNSGYKVIKRSINPVYRKLLSNKKRYLHLFGGAGSGKSVFAAQKMIIRLMTEEKHRILLIRKVARTIRHSQFSLLKALIFMGELGEKFKINEADLRITSLINGNEFISAGLDDREKLKSIFGITSIWVEEATELEYKDFSQLDLRLRGRSKNYKQIVLTYNPVNAHHWLNTKHFKDEFKFRTTFKDNKYIDEQYISVLKNLKEQDEEYYNIYALGEWGVLKNVIYRPFAVVNIFPAEYDEVIYGLDFGYNNQTALMEVNIKDKIFYLNELIYECGLTNSDLISRLKDLNIKRGSYIYCDSAEANRIEELKRAGFNVLQADKSVKDGIDYLKTCKIISNPDNTGINKEVLSYCYKQDKDGKLFDEPVKFNDHAMDAIRYAIYTHFKKRKEPKIRILQ
ncbi:MAG: PBSX family phage terminase large subunit [Ignavibacteriae bacterium]|nr:PBSX family phage terminase large subunit [Ignavibacteriota bacterium]